MSQPSPDEDTRPTIPIEHLPTWIVEDPDAAVSAVLEAGDILDGRYTVLEVRGGRGQTGMGVIYIVDDAGRFFAVKTFQAQHGRDLGFIQRFIREVETWMLTGFHANIVRPYKLEVIDALPYLFMEYVPSDSHGRHTLADYLRAGPLSADRALSFARQLCAGMCHATRAVPGLVHRDLKPGNLLIDPDGTLKITDFGLVRAGAESTGTLSALRQAEDLPPTLTRAGTTFGTPAYMAPEQFEAPEGVTTAADIYALGCCLYEMLAGKPPFEARRDGPRTVLQDLKHQHLHAPVPALDQRAPSCPPELAGIIHRCLAKQPEARWASFAEVAAALDRLPAGRGAPAGPLYNPGPREVAEQMQSLTLLEGYQKAIALKEVREHHVRSPYDLHLALASYFHCAGDPHEEARQLRRACKYATQVKGYEAVRRLADLLLAGEELETAAALLDRYLAAFPESVEHVLEPVVRLACARERYEEALRILAEQPETPRTAMLRVEVLEGRGETASLAAHLETLLETLLTRLDEKLQQVTPGTPSGWEESEDPRILARVLTLLAPGMDRSGLAHAKIKTWPDLGGYPDFSPEMAWLSTVLGKMAANSVLADSRRETARTCADMLGFPERLPRHVARDEYWFWLQQAGNNEVDE